MSANNENMEGVLRRIEKLLAIAQDDRTNPNEAAAAAAMAEKTMRKYQLAHADVILASIKRKEDLVFADYVATAKTNGTQVKKVPLWAGFLATAIARLHDCGSRQSTGGTKDAAVRFYGFAADVKVAVWTLDYLVVTVNRLCNEFKKTEAYALGGRATVNSYRQGVTAGLLQQLNRMTEQKRAEAEQAGQTSTGTALMVCKQQAIVEKFGEFKTRTVAPSISKVGAFSAGVRDGKKVNVGTRVIEPKADESKLLK